MRRIVQLPSAMTVRIDGLQGETFAIRMVTSIRSLQLINISPGQLYVFILTQDHKGRRTVTWGAQASNATDLDPRPYSVTTITFIGQPGNILTANVAGAWSGTNTLLQEKGKRRWRPQRLAQSQQSK